MDRDVAASIGAATEIVTSLDVRQAERGDLGDAVLRMEQLLNAAHALSAVLLARLQAEGTWADDGALSAAAWVAARTGTARHALRSRQRQGAAMALLPDVASAARRGRLSPGHLRDVGDCARRSPELAADHCQTLLRQAITLDAEGFRSATRHWHALADDVTGPHPAGVEAASHVRASRTFDGWLHLDGRLAPDDADIVEAALGAGVDRALRAAHDGDPSVEGQPVSQLRAGALVDLAAQSMRQEPSDASVPDRYRVAVLVRPGEPTLPAEAACDATAFRVVMDAESEVLDVGRQAARWPAAIRRAITVRDGGCVFPGCDRPPSWADIHHCTPWSEGGGTSVENGALVCRRHHTFIHQRHWQITIDRGVPTTRRPDGAPFVIRRWHPGARAS